MRTFRRDTISVKSGANTSCYCSSRTLFTLCSSRYAAVLVQRTLVTGVSFVVVELANIARYWESFRRTYAYLPAYTVVY